MQIKKFEGFMRTFCAAPPTATVTFVFMRFYKHTYIYLHKCILKSVLLYIHIIDVYVFLCVCVASDYPVGVPRTDQKFILQS